MFQLGQFSGEIDLLQSAFTQEVSVGARFEFGKNWARFLKTLDESRIAMAEESLKEMLKVDSLEGRSFLDVGCGSGLFSLAAMRLGAQVNSFDYDPTSVACAEYLKQKYFPGDGRWTVGQGSILDSEYLRTLGQYDFVYSWGVLHHTGAMWQALENAASLVKPGGRLFIAIYNDQGWISHYWRLMKRQFNRSMVHKFAVTGLHLPYFMVLVPLVQIVKGKYRLRRGMSRWHDLMDWLGGYPFEVAKPEQIFRFYRDRDFRLVELTTCGGRQGCNQYVYRKSGPARKS